MGFFLLKIFLIERILVLKLFLKVGKGFIMLVIPKSNYIIINSFSIIIFKCFEIRTLLRNKNLYDTLIS